MIINFENLYYLKSGNQRQKSTYKVLTKYKVMTLLESFDPILVGTIPISIDVETSDLDIVCYYSDKDEFIRSIRNAFEDKVQFCLTERKEWNAVVCSFYLDEFEIEIFGQDIPSKQQNGYRHMLVEYRLLCEKGETFRQEIIALKKQGHKTEPAFGLALGLKGDPYLELLKLVNK